MHVNGQIYAQLTLPQTRMVLTTAFETLAGGARWGGKSFAGIVWLGKGNQCMLLDDKGMPVGPVTHRIGVDIKHRAFGSYLEWPHYRALALRWEATDMKDWCDEFYSFWHPLYPKMKISDDPPVFVFPSGAKIYTNHLKDSKAYEKYKGWNITRVLIEELTQIADKDLYLKMLAVLRVPGGTLNQENVFPQIWSSTNPDGVGAAWVRDRFVYVPRVARQGGGTFPWGTTMTNPITNLNRVFMPARVVDNPHATEMYKAQLGEQSPAIRRAWLDGDWDALTGQYFDCFRPDGAKPLDPEPEKARHVIPRNSIVLEPWWVRWIGMDWGYAHNCAVTWFCETPNHRLITYREMVLNNVSSFNVGVETAKASLLDLAGLPSHHMTVFLSPDVMRFTDEAHTIGDQICAGFASVLGPDSAFIAQFTPGERELQRHDPDAAARALEQRRTQMEGRTQISILRASNDRVAGWSYMRDLMRWWKIAPQFDEANAKALFEAKGHTALEKYMLKIHEYQKKDEGPLPVWQILDCCPKLIRGLRDARRDETKPEDVTKKHWDGADIDDSARYGVSGRRDIMAIQPKSYFIADHLARARQEGITDINMLIQAGRYASETYEGKVGVFEKPLRLGRAAVPPMPALQGGRPI